MNALSFGTRILVLPSWIVSVGKSMVSFVFFMFLFSPRVFGYRNILMRFV